MHDGQVDVTGGVDTHGEQHVAAVVDAAGRILGTRAFRADAAGYRRLLRWMRGCGLVGRVGVEGTGSYGAGLARYLAGQGITVVEVNRPNRQARRRRGKSDPADAEAAARAALNGEASGTPKAGDGPVEALRALRVARRSAVKARTQAANQICGLIVTAPDSLRARLCTLDTPSRVRACARFRAGPVSDPAGAARRTLRCLARRYQALTAEITELDQAISQLCAQASPALLAARGVGAEVASALLVAAGDNPQRMRTEASFAALCGTSPILGGPGSSVPVVEDAAGERDDPAERDARAAGPEQPPQRPEHQPEAAGHEADHDDRDRCPGDRPAVVNRRRIDGGDGAWMRGSGHPGLRRPGLRRVGLLRPGLHRPGRSRDVRMPVICHAPRSSVPLGGPVR